MAAQFDQYADSYRDEVDRAIAFGGQGTEFYTAVKVDHLLRVVPQLVGAPETLSVLDVGCGVGLTGKFLVPRVRELHGVDVSEPEIERARANNPAASYRAYDGSTLPHEDSRFDIALAINVMHHVKPEAWPRFVSEMVRVVRPAGLVAVYEHNPYNPLTRLAVARCPFDADALLLRPAVTRGVFRGAGLRVVCQEHILYFPWRGAVWRALERPLRRLPLGAQYATLGRKGPA